jgi:transcriptional antiterminator NusG
MEGQASEALRMSLGNRLQLEPCPYLTAGQRVRVQAGPLAGLTGILLRRKRGARLVVTLDLIQRSVAVAVEVNEDDLMAVR